MPERSTYRTNWIRFTLSRSAQRTFGFALSLFDRHIERMESEEDKTLIHHEHPGSNGVFLFFDTERLKLKLSIIFLFSERINRRLYQNVLTQRTFSLPGISYRSVCRTKIFPGIPGTGVLRPLPFMRIHFSYFLCFHGNAVTQ